MLRGEAVQSRMIGRSSKNNDIKIRMDTSEGGRIAVWKAGCARSLQGARRRYTLSATARAPARARTFVRAPSYFPARRDRPPVPVASYLAATPFVHHHASGHGRLSVS